MPYIRIQINLAIPEGIYNAIPTAKKLAIRDRIRELKSHAVNINAGESNEENTTRAVWHKCYHDKPELNKSCGTEQEI